MYYKRNEPFRYTFEQPLTANIQAYRKEQEALVPAEKFEASILDISLNGMKVVTTANIDLLDHCEVHVSFELNEVPIEVHGELSWKKPLGVKFEYGILGNNSEEIQNLIISELKIYTKKHKKTKDV